MPQPPTDDVVAAFRTRHTLYEQFARRLEDLVVDLISGARIDTIQIESRAKTVESFTQKIERKDKNYRNPLVEVTDLVGLRIIAAYKEDVDPIGKLLADEFCIDESNSINKAAALDSDRFGYLSNHYVVSLKPTRASLPEWLQYRDLKAEIQVRTVLQHAWAAIDHKLSYKSAVDVPNSLQRRLFRLSALLELADEEFSAIKKQRDSLVAEHVLEVDSGNLSAGIDAATIDAYVSTRRDELLGLAPLDPWYDIDLVSDFGNDDLNDVLELLRVLRISTIADLDDILGHDLEVLRHDLIALSIRIGEKNITAGSIYDLVHALLILRRGDLSMRDDIELMDEYWDAISEAQEDRGYN